MRMLPGFYSIAHLWWIPGQQWNAHNLDMKIINTLNPGKISFNLMCNGSHTRPCNGMSTMTETETETDKMDKEQKGNLCWYLSLCNVNISSLSYTRHFYLYRSRCRPVLPHHKTCKENYQITELFVIDPV